MKRLRTECPKCGSLETRPSEARGLWESLLEAFGMFHFRCSQCLHRFRRQVWAPVDFFYAKCPRCFRLDLSTWDLRYYRPPLRTRLKLRLGARPLRCEACRCNFASWRPRKLRYQKSNVINLPLSAEDGLAPAGTEHSGAPSPATTGAADDRAAPFSAGKEGVPPILEPPGPVLSTVSSRAETTACAPAPARRPKKTAPARRHSLRKPGTRTLEPAANALEERPQDSQPPEVQPAAAVNERPAKRRTPKPGAKQTPPDGG